MGHAGRRQPLCEPAVGCAGGNDDALSAADRNRRHAGVAGAQPVRAHGPGAGGRLSDRRVPHERGAHQRHDSILPAAVAGVVPARRALAVVAGAAGQPRLCADAGAGTGDPGPAVELEPGIAAVADLYPC